MIFVQFSRAVFSYLFKLFQTLHVPVPLIHQFVEVACQDVVLLL